MSEFVWLDDAEADLLDDDQQEDEIVRAAWWDSAWSLRVAKAPGDVRARHRCADALDR